MIMGTFRKDGVLFHGVISRRKIMKGYAEDDDVDYCVINEVEDFVLRGGKEYQVNEFYLHDKILSFKNLGLTDKYINGEWHKYQ